jgi:hypothetical protein
LSRAEAAIKAASRRLAELEALPEVARAEMTDWTARATQRADVLDAIATLPKHIIKTEAAPNALVPCDFFVAAVMAATFGAIMLLEMEGSATIDIGGQVSKFLGD